MGLHTGKIDTPVGLKSKMNFVVILSILILHYVYIILYIIRFTSLCKIFIYLSFFAAAFWRHVDHFQSLEVPVEIYQDHQALKMVHMAPKSL